MTHQAMKSEIHPTQEMLVEFIHGRLDDGASGNIEQHLESCESCCQILANISSDEDRFVEAVVSAADTGPDSTTDGGPLTSTILQIPTSIGRFCIREQIGRGGFGVVLLAHDEHLHRDVAIKLPRDGAFLTQIVRQRFLREARAAASLDHPHIVPVYEAGEENGWCYLACAYCRGPNLAHWLAEQTEPVGVETAVKLILSLAEAVDHAHERGVLHRDIKPANILLDPIESRRENGNGFAYVPKISDFGLAKVATAEADATHSNVVMGTVSYMAPEQARGKNDEVGQQADVYGLGAVLYELLTKRIPIVGQTDLETLQRIQHQDPIPPRRLVPHIPVDLETICLKTLEKKPHRRYQSAGELADDLRFFLQGKPIRARPVTTTAKLSKWMRRNPVVTAISLCLFVSMICLLVGSWLHTWRLGSEVKRRTAAEQQTKQSLVESRILTARMGRLSGWSGQRFDGIDTLRDAVNIAQQNNLTIDWRQLRSEAIGVMALADVHRRSSWQTEGLHGWIKRADLSDDLSVAAYSDQGGRVLVCDLDGESVLAEFCLDHVPLRVCLARGANKVICVSGPFENAAAYVFDWKNPTPQPHILPVEGAAVDACVSPDGKRVAIVTQTGEISQFSLESLSALGSFEVPTYIDGCRYTVDSSRLIAWGNDRVIIYDLNGSSTQDFTAPNQPDLQVAALSPDGMYLAAGGSSHDVYLWSHYNDSGSPKTLERHQGWITNITFSSDSCVLVTSSSDGITRLWESNAAQELVALSGQGIRLDRSDRQMGGLVGNEIVRWEIETGRECRMIPSRYEAYDGSVSPDGGLLATVSMDGVSIWSLPDGGQQELIAGEAYFAKFMNMPDGLEIFLGTSEGVFRAPVRWVPDEKLECGPATPVNLHYECDCANQAAVSENGIVVVCVDFAAAVIVDLNQPDKSSVIPHHDLSGVSISNDGSQCVLFTQHQAGIKVVDTKTKTVRRILDQFWICGAKFNPNGNALLVDTHRALLVLDTKTLEIRQTIDWIDSSESIRWPTEWAFSNAGRMLAIRRIPYIINLIDLETSTVLADIPVRFPFPWVQLTPDGSWMICTDKRLKTQIWDMTSIRHSLSELNLDWTTGND